jgi:hypothetical protein
MVDRGNADKHRQGIPGGPKAIEEQKWGRETARQRYGKLDQSDMRPSDYNEHAPQRLGDRNNLQDNPTYRNDTPENWVRGMPRESAEGKSNFDHRGNPNKWTSGVHPDFGKRR